MRLTLTALVTVQVIMSGGEVRQPTPILGRMWFLKPWPFESIEVIISLLLVTFPDIVLGSGFEPLT